MIPKKQLNNNGRITLAVLRNDLTHLQKDFDKLEREIHARLNTIEKKIDALNRFDKTLMLKYGGTGFGGGAIATLLVLILKAWLGM